MTHISRQLGSLLFACITFVMPGPLAAQERAMVPLAIDGEQVRLATITYKPPGNGPFPTLIFHHGSTGRGRDPALFERPYDPKALAGWFTARGWAVILPSRRGRGGSEGVYDEGFEPDRAQGYSCDPTRALAGAERALAAGGAEHVEIPPAVSQRIVGIAVAVEPDRRSLEGAGATEDLRIDVIDGGATIAQPSADEVHDGARHRGLPAAPGNGKNAAARHAADGDPLAIDKGLRQKHRRDGIDVAQGTLGEIGRASCRERVSECV